MRPVEAVLIAALALVPLASSAQSAGTGGDTPPRLKFRVGPPCMCNDGLDEQAIREAERRRQWNRHKQDVPRPESSEENGKGE
jgi:hypothetical protein